MTEQSRRPKDLKVPKLAPSKPVPRPAPSEAKTEAGGREGPDPTRYGDWERNGIAIDF